VACCRWFQEQRSSNIGRCQRSVPSVRRIYKAANHVGTRTRLLALLSFFQVFFVVGSMQITSVIWLCKGFGTRIIWIGRLVPFPWWPYVGLSQTTVVRLHVTLRHGKKSQKRQALCVVYRILGAYVLGRKTLILCLLLLGAWSVRRPRDGAQ